MIEPVTFKPERPRRIKPPTLQEVLALNGGELPRIAGAGNNVFETLVNSLTFSSTNAGTILEKSTTNTAISPGGEAAGEAFALPPSTWQVGTKMVIKAGGYYGTANAEVEWQIIPWFIPSGIKLSEAGANKSVRLLPEAVAKAKTAAAARKKFGWHLEMWSKCIAIGAKGKFITQGVLTMSTESAKASTVFCFPNGEAAAFGESEEINLASECRLVLGCKIGTESAEDFIVCNQFDVELLN